jgi:predicted DNA-binding transcriptional regulator YafY
MTHLQRSLRIIQRLLTFNRVTVNELYDHFEQNESKRTIQRTLNDIEGSGFPLTCEIGAHGEKSYSLQHKFKFPALMLKPEEILAAMLLNQFSEYFEGTEIGESIRRVFENMEQFVPRESIAVVSAFGSAKDTFKIHEPGRVDLKPISQILMILFGAIISCKICWVKYHSKRYQIHPYSLLLHGGVIYAIVFQPIYENFIYLSLRRIERINATDEVFKRDPKFKLSDFMRDKFGIWSAKPEKVLIRFDDTVAGSIEGRIWHSSQTLKAQSNGDLDLTMKVGITEELIAWILRWGPFAEVLEPQSLRVKMRTKLKETLKAYK